MEEYVESEKQKEHTSRIKELAKEYNVLYNDYCSNKKGFFTSVEQLKEELKPYLEQNKENTKENKELNKEVENSYDR